MKRIKFLVEVEVDTDVINEKDIEIALTSFDNHLNEIGLWEDKPLTTHLTTMVDLSKT